MSAMLGRLGEAGTGLRRVWAGSGLVLTFESHSLCCILPLLSPDFGCVSYKETQEALMDLCPHVEKSSPMCFGNPSVEWQSFLLEEGT